MTSSSPQVETSVSNPSSWIRPAAASLAAAGILGALVLIRPDLMMVEQVAFVGNERASAESLRHLVDVQNGTTMWGADLTEAETGAVQHPWVRHARAARQWPSTVVVEVVEYDPVAIVQWGGMKYVDADGTVFLGSRTDDLDYPLLTGIDDELAASHPALPPLAIRDALWLLESLDVGGLAPREQVSEVSFSGSRGFTVHLNSGAEVLFGLDGLERQVERLAALQREHDLSLDRPVMVDLGPRRVAIVRPLHRTPAVADGQAL